MRFLPSSSRRRTAVRNATLPSPIVILPLMSRTVTSPAWRSSIFNSAIVRNLLYELRLTSLEHAHCCTTFRSDQPVDLIHKGAHKKDAAARSFQDVLVRCWVWDVLRIETRALIVDADFHAVRGVLQDNINGLVCI